MNALKQYLVAAAHVVLVIALVLAGLATASVRADDLAPPPWRLSSAESTFQHWEFSGGVTPVELPENWVNPFGQPQENVSVRTNATWHNVYGGRQGVWELDGGYLQWEIPNAFHPTLPKWVRVQFTVNIPVVNWGGNPKVGPVTQLETDPLTGITWYHHWADYVIPCVPFSVFLQGTLAADQLVVDSLCVPEPGSLLLSTIGFGAVGAALRRRRKVS